MAETRAVGSFFECCKGRGNCRLQPTAVISNIEHFSPSAISLISTPLKNVEMQVITKFPNLFLKQRTQSDLNFDVNSMLVGSTKEYKSILLCSTTHLTVHYSLGIGINNWLLIIKNSSQLQFTMKRKQFIFELFSLLCSK